MENKHFELTMSNYETVVNFKYDHSDVTSDEVMQAIVGCMRSLTWSDDQILKMCIDYIEEYSDYKVITEND